MPQPTASPTPGPSQSASPAASQSAQPASGQLAADQIDPPGEVVATAMI